MTSELHTRHIPGAMGLCNGEVSDLLSLYLLYDSLNRNVLAFIDIHVNHVNSNPNPNPNLNSSPNPNSSTTGHLRFTRYSRVNNNSVFRNIQRKIMEYRLSIPQKSYFFYLESVP